MSQKIAVVTRSRNAGGRQGPGSGRKGAAVAPERSEGERVGGGGSEPERSGGATAGAAAPPVRLVGPPISPMPEHGPSDDRGVEVNGALDFSAPDPEVAAKPARRRFTAAYKARILREAEACRKPGQIGELVRREGLYTAHLSAWRKQRDAGALDALAPKKRGRKAALVNPLARRVAEQEREIRRLEAELQKAKTIIDVQKKLSQLLETPPNDPPIDENA